LSVEHATARAPRRAISLSADVRALTLAALALIGTGAAHADPLADLPIDLHAQYTGTVQAHPAFPSAFSGGNSLNRRADAAMTNDITLYIGLSPWKGAELWVNPEIDQGFGLSDTLGVAGFPSSEAYKVGKQAPYYKTPRAFLRQTINLGGATEQVEADANQHKLSRTADKLVITLGKFGVTDIFDANSYAHDPRRDFMNWAVIDTGSFDYAANSWGFTIGGAVELYHGAWTARAALMALSNVPNGESIDTSFAQRQWIGEIERRFTLGHRPGVVRLTGFDTYGRMGRYGDALALAAASGATPDTASVRRYAHRDGLSINAEQVVSDSVGVFARVGIADGSKEAYDFTDIDRTVEAGVSVTGKNWHRKDDVFGAVLLVNDISKAAQAYFTSGGLGVLVGDGALRHKAQEVIAELTYTATLKPWAHLSLDGQMVFNPAYNSDRGPAPVIALRLHLAR